MTTYLTDGIEALDIKKQPGRHCALTPKQKQQLKDYVCKHAVKDEGGRLIGEDILEYIIETFDVQYKH